MEIRKYRHSCLVIAKNNQSIIIDPGSWTTDLQIPKDTVGIIVTHEHADHFDIDRLKEIINKNPSVYIYAHVDVIAQLGEMSRYGRSVAANETVNIGNFIVTLTGGHHAIIHPDHPVCANLGILVDNGELYYPGDSFDLPGCTIKTLAVPASAPWMKISEAMDFITAVKPETCFPTHNALLSAEGHALAAAWLTKAADNVGTTYQEL